MIIRTKTFKHWLKANFSRSELEDLVYCGANTGWRGLTYYSHTTKLYERFKDEIWEHITEESEANGYSNPFRYLSECQFVYPIYDAVTMEQWVVRYVAESMAYRLTKNKRNKNFY